MWGTESDISGMVLVCTVIQVCSSVVSMKFILWHAVWSVEMGDIKWVQTWLGQLLTPFPVAIAASTLNVLTTNAPCHQRIGMHKGPLPYTPCLKNWSTLKTLWLFCTTKGIKTLKIWTAKCKSRSLGRCSDEIDMSFLDNLSECLHPPVSFHTNNCPPLP